MPFHIPSVQTRRKKPAKQSTRSFVLAAPMPKNNFGLSNWTRADLFREVETITEDSVFRDMSRKSRPIVSNRYGEGLRDSTIDRVVAYLDVHFNPNRRFGGLLLSSDVKEHFDKSGNDFGLFQYWNLIDSPAMNLLYVPGHVAVEVYKPAISGTVATSVIYDSARDKRIRDKYIEQCLSYHAHSPTAQLRIGIDLNYRSLPEGSGRCAYNSLCTLVTLLMELDPADFDLKKNGVFLLCKIAHEKNSLKLRPNFLLADLVDLVAHRKKDRKKHDIVYEVCSYGEDDETMEVIDFVEEAGDDSDRSETD